MNLMLLPQTPHPKTPKLESRSLKPRNNLSSTPQTCKICPVRDMSMSFPAVMLKYESISVSWFSRTCTSKQGYICLFIVGI